MTTLEKLLSHNDDELIEDYLSNVSPDEFRANLAEFQAQASNGLELFRKLAMIGDIINNPIPDDQP